MKRIAKPVVVTAALLALASAAFAQSAATMTDAEVTGRLAFIQKALDGGQHAADLWWYGWLGGYTGATAAQLAVRSSSHDEKQRQDMLVGAATTALGAVGTAIFPVEAGCFASRLRAIPADTPEARRAKLATAESYLRRAAAQEELGRSWKAHVTSAVVNLAAGLVIWKHYDRSTSDGVTTFALGQLVSEAQIFTQPMKAVRDLREYERKTDFTQPATSAANHPEWYFGASPGGVVVGVRF
jgi:hypothetical protein